MTRKSIIEGYDGPVVMDRRAFMGSMGVALGGAVAGMVMPSSALFAAPERVMVQYPPTDSAPDGVWDVDDVFGLFPRYNHPIGHGRPRPARQEVAEAAVHPADRNFLV